MILAPLLLEEEPLVEIRGADDLAVAAGEPQVRDAGVEVLDETLDDPGSSRSWAWAKSSLNRAVRAA